MTAAMDRAAIRRINLRAWMDRYGMTQTDLAMKMDKSRSYVSLLLSDDSDRPFGEKSARYIEGMLHMPSGYLDAPIDNGSNKKTVMLWSVPSDLQDDVYAMVPRVAVSLAAGNGGRIVETEQELPPLAFRRDWMQTKCVTSKKNLKVLEVRGESMTPYLQDGDSVLIDMGQGDIQDNQIYAIWYGDELRIKRLSKRFDGGILIRSDNPAYQDEVLSQEEARHITVLGKLLWRGG
jgi:phage repressor protein C with HTH and peptisase S24 domain